MSLEVAGKLHKILQEQKGSGKNGAWVKQEFIIETNDQFPKKICCSVWGDKTASLNGLAPGDELKVSINLESREYNERWYTEVKAWKIEKSGQTKSSGGGSKDDPSFPEEMPLEPDDVLPF